MTINAEPIIEVVWSYFCQPFFTNTHIISGLCCIYALDV